VTWEHLGHSRKIDLLFGLVDDQIVSTLIELTTDTFGVGARSVEQTLSDDDGHDRVTDVETVSPNRYDVTREDGTTVKVFMTNAHTFSAADYAEKHAAHADVDCVVSASKFNHFSDRARSNARDDGVATVHVGELMGALHKTGNGFLDYPSG
jgi:hypothetical protein